MSTSRLLGLLIGIGVAAFGCGDDRARPSATSSGPSDAQADATSGRRTLDTCATSIAADVPAFYRKYFKCVTVTKTADAVVVATEGLPPHLSYYYGSGDPNFEAFDTSRGPAYKPNPNRLAPKSIRVTIPDAPVAKPGLVVTQALVDGFVGTSPEEYALGPVGVALDSVALFNPLARPGDDIEAEKFTFDGYDAHPAPDGTYHYHRLSRGPREVVSAVGGASELLGVMCDGTVVLGCSELDGATPAGTLDAQGGHVGDIRDADGTVHFTGRYHTHLCASGRAYTPEVQYYGTCAR